jgi:GntR family transcriptional repressor for pyruvate dehydrogenase complex
MLIVMSDAHVPKSVGETSQTAAKRLRIEPIHRGNMVEETVQRLESCIFAGTLAAGEQLPPEGRLAETIGVSRTVIREAMRNLAARGLIEVSQGKPARVRPADPEQVSLALHTFLQRGGHPLLHLIEVRIPLETEIAALAAVRATPAQIAQLEENNAYLAETKTLADGVEADLCFHRLLAEATGNPVFGLLLKTLGDLMKQSRETTFERTGVPAAYDGHQEITAAVRRADSEAARGAMLRHLFRAKGDLQGSQGEKKEQDQATRPAESLS